MCQFILNDSKSLTNASDEPIGNHSSNALQHSSSSNVNQSISNMVSCLCMFLRKSLNFSDKKELSDLLFYDPLAAIYFGSNAMNCIFDVLSFISDRVGSGNELISELENCVNQTHELLISRVFESAKTASLKYHEWMFLEYSYDLTVSDYSTDFLSYVRFILKKTCEIKRVSSEKIAQGIEQCMFSFMDALANLAKEPCFEFSESFRKAMSSRVITQTELESMTQVCALFTWQ